MSEREPHEDERRLQALFDQTASEPEPEVLDRLARSAAQIPEVRRPWYEKLWRRQPWAMGVVAAAAALALVVGMSLDDDAAPRDPVALVTPSAGTAAPVPSAVTDEGLDELLAFDVTDSLDGEVATLDADPLGAWDDGEDVLLANDNPIEALDLLFYDPFDEVDTLGSAFDDVLAEGG